MNLRTQLGDEPSHLAVVPDRTQVLVVEPLIRRYPDEQEYVHTDPASFELVQVTSPWAGEAKEFEH